jgi:diguanylate cyclase (GGDEF)-like protein
MSDLPFIALSIESAAQKRHWRNLLAGVRCQVISGDELASGSSPVDIVVTDGHQTLEAAAFQQPPAAIHGVITIGAGAGDVVFAEDPTDRELQLACDLLFQLVLLRRERAASQQRQQLLAELAELDGLTGIPNRRAWDAELARRMSSGSAADTNLCLALFDLDHFKAVNTRHGYPAADKVLQLVASTLKAGTRGDDFVARIGGDEFGVLLANLSAERAELVVERIRASVEPALEQSGLAVVTATAGLALRQPVHNAETLFAAADINLRQGKSAGRNRTIC